jgi:ribosomal protein L35AE/L33A
MEIINVSDEIIEVNVTEEIININIQPGAYPLPGSISSVFGRTGAVVATSGDYNTTQVTEGTNLYYTNARSRAAISETITGINYDSASGIFSMASGYAISTTASQATWDAAYNDKINSAAVTGTSTKTLTLNQQDGGTITASWTDTATGLTSVGLSMPAAFSVSGSPLTSNGTISVTGSGTTAQYIRGDGTLATFPTITSESTKLIREVYNNSGATLTKGTVIYINGGQGNLPTIAKALGTGDATSAQTYGVVQNDISNMSNGYIVVVGDLIDMPTNSFVVGTQLYLSSTTAGEYTSTKQYAPAHLVYVGIVTRSHPTQGIIAVKIQNGYEMDELHDVAAQSPNDGDILKYVSSTSLWTKTAGSTTNIAEGTNLYYPDVRARASNSFVAGSGAYNSTTGVITIPTNNNQITNGSNYITLTSLSASTGISYNNTTGAISSTITQYTDALSRAAISLTTTGSSGAATYNSTTGVLNIPQYSGGGGSITLSAIGSTPNANAATLTGSALNLEPASASFGGVVTTGTQTFAGAKTFSSDLTISGVLIQTVTTNRQTASYTLVLADRGKLVEMNVATANNLTIPLNSSVAFPIGTQIDLSQYGAGQTTIVPTSGVTIRSTNSWVKLNARYAAATLIKIGTDEWYLFGNLNA